MKTPEQILSEITGIDIRYLSKLDEIIRITPREALYAIEAYHDQFTIEPSERERQIAIEFAIYCPDEQGGMGQIFDSFTQSDAYKSIPARSVEPAKTMPSREEVFSWAIISASNMGKTEIAKMSWIQGVMAMYDYLTSNLNNLK